MKEKFCSYCGSSLIKASVMSAEDISLQNLRNIVKELEAGTFKMKDSEAIALYQTAADWHGGMGTLGYRIISLLSKWLETNYGKRDYLKIKVPTGVKTKVENEYKNLMDANFFSIEEKPHLAEEEIKTATSTSDIKEMIKELVNKTFKMDVQKAIALYQFAMNNHEGQSSLSYQLGSLLGKWLHDNYGHKDYMKLKISPKYMEHVKKKYSEALGLPKSDYKLFIAYEVVTPESAELGDFEDTGEHDTLDIDGEDPIEDVIDQMKRKGIVRASSSFFHKGIWYESSEDEDYETGARTTYTFHLKGFSQAEEKEVYDRLKKEHLI